ncbi:ATP-binding protein [Nocardioides marmorisolisilvae]|uniref:ATP-binding protein n=1 Tax=Nocardioides marmorisolisilvae TaxID=1542737 RepID=UPI001FE4FA16|nr:LuxR C-terminal-related transcriptional regulator [Nocardioides marmorisolisilvae]
MQLPPPPAGVSRREGEVLALVGEHLTNAEIAERLFISVRTVESHVATLLRKLDLPDKRALAAHAVAATGGSGSGAAADEDLEAADLGTAVLPVALTSFVGRHDERRALVELVENERLVTLLGPGGVGKTRLVTVTAGDLVGVFDGVWYVDLVPVADPDSIAAAVAGVLGVKEIPGRTLTETLSAWIGSRRLLIVLDNCEHVLDGAAAFAERMLAGCEKLTLLATSRTRLMLPFERVFAVPGLSLPAGDDPGDAVRLFEERATTVGAALGEADRDRVAAICFQLDGVALAIELAASRLPSLGLDGLEAGLTEPLLMLSGGTRVHERHHSLRATLDWSWSLLDDDRRALLEQVCVFAMRFSAADAAAVVEPEASVAATVEGLAHLVDNSLLIARPSPTGTRYRALETVRQYGQELLEERGQLDGLRSRHLRWCLGTASALHERQETGDPTWRTAFDQVSDDLRAALMAAAGDDVTDDVASRLAVLLARLDFARGQPAAAQRGFAQAAQLAQRPADQLAALIDAANSALARQSGNDYLRLLDQAVALAEEVDDRTTAAVLSARAAEVIMRFQGVFPEPLTRDDAVRYLDAAIAVGSTDLGVRASVALAEVGVEGGLDRAEAAVELARASGDPLLLSAGLDAVTAEILVHGDLAGAARTVQTRMELLATVPEEIPAAMELNDCYLMGADVLIAAGDLRGAAESADRLAALPFYEGVQYVAISRQLRVDFAVGEIAKVVEGGERFERTWDRAGRPAIGQLGPSALSVAAAHALRGDDDRATAWRSLCRDLRGGFPEPSTSSPSFDALVLLHRDDPHGVLALLPDDPSEGKAVGGAGANGWHLGLWRPWWTAYWAEASVLADLPDALERVERTRPHVTANPIASAILDRAAALAAGDLDAVLATQEAMRAAGCRYQEARTLLLAGKRHRTAGVKLMAELGIPDVT